MSFFLWRLCVFIFLLLLFVVEFADGLEVQVHLLTGLGAWNNVIFIYLYFCVLFFWVANSHPAPFLVDLHQLKSTPLASWARGWRRQFLPAHAHIRASG
jgi:hypothetical protein